MELDRMTNLLFGTVQWVTNSTQRLAGVSAISNRIRQMLNPSTEGLSVMEKRLLLSIQRQMECIIQPLQYCIIWARYRDSGIGKIIKNVQEILVAVCAFIQPHLENACYSEVPLQEFGRSGENSQVQSGLPFRQGINSTRSFKHSVQKSIGISLGNYPSTLQAVNPSQSSTFGSNYLQLEECLQYCFYELNFAYTLLNMAMSFIQTADFTNILNSSSLSYRRIQNLAFMQMRMPAQRYSSYAGNACLPAGVSTPVWATTTSTAAHVGPAAGMRVLSPRDTHTSSSTVNSGSASSGASSASWGNQSFQALPGGGANLAFSPTAFASDSMNPSLHPGNSGNSGNSGSSGSSGNFKNANKATNSTFAGSVESPNHSSHQFGNVRNFFHPPFIPISSGQQHFPHACSHLLNPMPLPFADTYNGLPCDGGGGVMGGLGLTLPDSPSGGGYHLGGASSRAGLSPLALLRAAHCIEASRGKRGDICIFVGRFYYKLMLQSSSDSSRSLFFDVENGGIGGGATVNASQQHLFSCYNSPGPPHSFTHTGGTAPYFLNSSGLHSSPGGTVLKSSQNKAFVCGDATNMMNQMVFASSGALSPLQSSTTKSVHAHTRLQEGGKPVFSGGAIGAGAVVLTPPIPQEPGYPSNGPAMKFSSPPSHNHRGAGSSFLPLSSSFAGGEGGVWVPHTPGGSNGSFGAYQHQANNYHYHQHYSQSLFHAPNLANHHAGNPSHSGDGGMGPSHPYHHQHTQSIHGGYPALSSNLRNSPHYGGQDSQYTNQQLKGALHTHHPKGGTHDRYSEVGNSSYFAGNQIPGHSYKVNSTNGCALDHTQNYYQTAAFGGAALLHTAGGNDSGAYNFDSHTQPLYAERNLGFSSNAADVRQQTSFPPPTSGEYGDCGGGWKCLFPAAFLSLHRSNKGSDIFMCIESVDALKKQNKMKSADMARKPSGFNDVQGSYAFSMSLGMFTCDDEGDDPDLVYIPDAEKIEETLLGTTSNGETVQSLITNPGAYHNRVINTRENRSAIPASLAAAMCCKELRFPISVSLDCRLATESIIGLEQATPPFGKGFTLGSYQKNRSSSFCGSSSNSNFTISSMQANQSLSALNSGGSGLCVNNIPCQNAAGNVGSTSANNQKSTQLTGNAGGCEAWDAETNLTNVIDREVLTWSWVFPLETGGLNDGLKSSSQSFQGSIQEGYSSHPLFLPSNFAYNKLYPGGAYNPSYGGAMGYNNGGNRAMFAPCPAGGWYAEAPHNFEVHPPPQEEVSARKAHTGAQVKSESVAAFTPIESMCAAEQSLSAASDTTGGGGAVKDDDRAKTLSTSDDSLAVTAEETPSQGESAEGYALDDVQAVNQPSDVDNENESVLEDIDVSIVSENASRQEADMRNLRDKDAGSESKFNQNLTAKASTNPSDSVNVEGPQGSDLLSFPLNTEEKPTQCAYKESEFLSFGENTGISNQSMNVSLPVNAMPYNMDSRINGVDASRYVVHYAFVFDPTVLDSDVKSIENYGTSRIRQNFPVGTQDDLTELDFLYTSRMCLLETDGFHTPLSHDQHTKTQNGLGSFSTSGFLPSGFPNFSDELLYTLMSNVYF